MRQLLPDAAATRALARRFAAALPARTAGLTLLLEGDLGTGKSTFARALILALGHTGPVPSPTYTLVEPYEVSTGTIYHVDLYRVTSEDELRYLGFSELDDGLCIVEWPDRVPAVTARADIAVSLCYRDSGREAVITGLSTRGRSIVAAAERATVTEPLY